MAHLNTRTFIYLANPERALFILSVSQIRTLNYQKLYIDIMLSCSPG